MADVLTSAKGMFCDGAVEKAVLYILNPIYDDLSDADIGKKANEAMKKIKKGAKEKGMMDMVNDQMPSNVPGEKKYSFGNDAQGGKIGKVSDISEEFIKVEVQFNPDSIKLYSAIGKQQELNRNDGGMGRLHLYRLAGKTRMSFQLVFDDVNVPDAFMLEGVPSNLTSAGQALYDQYKGGKHSIRKQMDAFLSLLASLRTQQVIFAWSKLTFRGMLTNVSNKYIMFNTKGSPVRGTMHLEITQESKAENQFNYDDTEWDDAFKARFSQSDSVFSSSGSNNLINLTM